MSKTARSPVARRSKRGSAAVKRASVVRALRWAPVGQFALGLELVVLLTVVGILAVVAL